MQTVLLHADARANGRERARSRFLERRLGQYHPLVRTRVCAFAERHSRVMDLAGSFPALLFALAVPRAGVAVEAIVQRVIEGAPLRELAQRAQVPLWLRSVEPRAFTAPLPVLPDDDIFRRQIVNLIPSEPRRFALWAQAVSDAARWSDQAVALWVAHELHRHPKQVQLSRLPGVSLWAWYSRFAYTQGLHRPPYRWVPKIAFDYALSLSRQWFEQVALRLELDAPVADMWLTPGTVDGYTFVPLRSADDIAAEAAAMKHCVATYGGNVRHGYSRLWSVQRDGARAATLAIGFPTDDPLPWISDIKSAANHDAPVEIWRAARAWVASQDLAAKIYVSAEPAGISRAAWIKQWRPYWLAKRTFPPWLPLAPSPGVLDRLLRGPPVRWRPRRRLPG